MRNLTAKETTFRRGLLKEEIYHEDITECVETMLKLGQSEFGVTTNSDPNSQSYMEFEQKGTLLPLRWKEMGSVRVIFDSFVINLLPQG
jgi:hypothetical protein